MQRPAAETSESKKCLNISARLIAACKEQHFLNWFLRTSKDLEKKLISVCHEKKENANVFYLAESAKVVAAGEFVNTAMGLSVRTAVLPAEVAEYKFSCRLDSIADNKRISDAIVNSLRDNNISFPSRLLYASVKLNAKGDHPIHPKRHFQVNLAVSTIFGPVTLCNNNVKKLLYNDTHALPGNACVRKSVLGSLFFITIG